MKGEEKIRGWRWKMEGGRWRKKMRDREERDAGG